MRAWATLLIVALAHRGSAGPTYTKTPIHSTSADAVAAERAWTAAETEKDPHAVSAAWQTAARAFDKAVASTSGSSELAYAAVLAWKNAIATDAVAPPHDASAITPLSANEVAMIKALDVFVPMASADEAPGMLFIRAHTFQAHNRFDDAMPTWIEIITKHPQHETAGYAASLLLDALNRQGKVDALADWVEKLRGNKALLAHEPELTATLTDLHVTVFRHRAEAFEAAGRAGDVAAFQRCASIYVDLDRTMPAYARADELLFDAGVCFEGAGATVAAKQEYRDLAKRFPHSKLVAKARARAKLL